MYHQKAYYEKKVQSIYFWDAKSLLGAPHMHKDVEILYVWDGHCDAYIDSKHYTLKEGDLFVSFANQIHYYENAPVGRYYVFTISPKIFFGMEKLLFEKVPTNNVLHLTEADPILHLLVLSHKAYTQFKVSKNQLMLNGYLNLLLGHILNHLELKPYTSAESSTLRLIMNYCMENFHDDISLEKLSQDLSFGKYYISHLINKKLNMNLNDYINTLRIDAACQLLRGTNIKIADISEDVGFGTIRSFNRVFLKQMGLTPKDYRLQNSKKQ